MRELEGKTAVVTGAAAGTGRAMAAAFAARGMNVALADIEEPALKAAVKELEAGGAHVIGVRCDVEREEDLLHVADAAWSRFDDVHVLANAACVRGWPGKSWELSYQNWAGTLHVNLWGIIHAIRAFVPRMIEEDEEGHIVIVTPLSGLLPATGTPPYAVASRAVISLSETLAAELKAAGTRIGVSLVFPEESPEAAAAKTVEAIMAEQFYVPTGTALRAALGAYAERLAAVMAALPSK